MRSLFAFLFIIFLVTFPHLCLASSGDGAEVSSFEQPTLIQPEGESIGPATTEASLIFSPASVISGASGEEPDQVAIANIPPAPAEAEEEVATIPDPIEPVNRAFFTFNDKLYFWI